MKKKFKHTADGRKQEPLSIYDVLGMKATPYGTTDEPEYRKKINSMNLSDLQSHAMELGLKPSNDRRFLEERLVKQFKVSRSSYKAASVKRPKMDPEKRERAKKIMSSGR